MAPTSETEIPKADPILLTQYIEANFHALHRRQLPELLRLAQKVERVHVAAAGVPAGLSIVLEELSRELESHMQKEEQVLFPAIRRGLGQELHHPISVMRTDHVDHAEHIAKIQRMTSNLLPPAGVYQSWTALYLGLRQFILDLEEHIEIENDVLFPNFEGNSKGDVCGCSCQGHD